MKKQRSDIESIQDIQFLVNLFYARVREDDLLSPIFESVIGEKWDDHFERMYRFWETVLLGRYTYIGSPFPPHLNLPVEGKHFNRWLVLFESTVDSFFAGEKADKAKMQASKMAEMFEAKISFYRNQGFEPLA